MTPSALGLVLAAAACHATWNLVVKRVGGGPAFAWAFTAASAVLYAPLGVAALIVVRPDLTAAAWLFIAGNGVLHVVYLLTLLRGYRAGDLSVVYPVARGTGPMLAAVAAIVLLGERPSPLGLAGIVLIGVGVLSLGWNTGARSSAEGVWWGVLTGAVIATYTLWDQHAVAVLALPALFYDWAGDLVRSAALYPAAARRPGEIAAAWREHRREVLVVAVLAPLAYILVLTALVSAPVSYVAPAREVSILIGAMLGARVLGEPDLHRRLPAAAAIVAGVVAIAVA